MEVEEVNLLFEIARRQQVHMLDEPAGKQVLALHGIRVPRSVVVPDGGSFEHVTTSLTFPLVLKVVSADVVHKTDVGGVRLNIRSIDELEEASAEVRESVGRTGATVQAWLVEEMADAGIEMVVGGLQDPEFGPMIMLGMGGIFVEVFEDVSFRICPVNRTDVLEMIDELKSSALLKGARGRASVDPEILVDVMLKVGGQDGILMAAQEHIAELDINPLILSSSGAMAVDARFILQGETRDGQ